MAVDEAYESCDSTGATTVLSGGRGGFSLSSRASREYTGPELTGSCLAAGGSRGPGKAASHTQRRSFFGERGLGYGHPHTGFAADWR